jgi:hypothetical protein
MPTMLLSVTTTDHEKEQLLHYISIFENVAFNMNEV